MELLYWFESIRRPMLDIFMSLVTHLGEETFFMVGALFVFWCVDKRKGYYLLSVGFVGTLINQWLKIICRVPRPWVRDPHFTIVEAARAEATGYSFPSGHTQTAVGFFGGVARFTSRLWLRVVCVLILLLVSVSRMYLGVHTPSDVGVSFLVGALLVFFLYPLIESILWFPERVYAILGTMLAFSLAFVAFMEFYTFPAGLDGENFASAIKNAYSMAGAVGGMLVVSVVDEKLLHFPNRAPWWGQTVKLLGGLVLVIFVKSVLKAPLLALLGGHAVAHSVRYFLMVLAAGCLWPITFRFFARYAK